MRNQYGKKTIVGGGRCPAMGLRKRAEENTGIPMPKGVAETGKLGLPASILE